MSPAEIEGLYREHARRLAGYLMRATNNAEVAADLTARLTVPGGLRMQGPVHDGPKNMRGDYYLVAVPPHIGRGARINWLDKDKQPGSRGTRLLPPVSGKVRR